MTRGWSLIAVIVALAAALAFVVVHRGRGRGRPAQRGAQRRRELDDRLIRGALLLDGSPGNADTSAAILDTTGRDYSVDAWVRLDALNRLCTAVSSSSAAARWTSARGPSPMCMSTTAH